MLASEGLAQSPEIISPKSKGAALSGGTVISRRMGLADVFAVWAQAARFQHSFKLNSLDYIGTTLNTEAKTEVGFGGEQRPT